MRGQTYVLWGTINVPPNSVTGQSKKFLGLFAPQGASVRRPGGPLYIGRIGSPEQDEPIAPDGFGFGCVYTFDDTATLLPVAGDVMELCCGSRTIATMTVEEVECPPSK